MTSRSPTQYLQQPWQVVPDIRRPGKRSVSYRSWADLRLKRRKEGGFDAGRLVVAGLIFVFSLSLNFRKYFYHNSSFQHSSYRTCASTVFKTANMQYKIILAALAAAQLALAAPVPSPEAMETREATAAPEEVSKPTAVLSFLTQ